MTTSASTNPTMDEGDRVFEKLFNLKMDHVDLSDRNQLFKMIHNVPKETMLKLLLGDEYNEKCDGDKSDYEASEWRSKAETTMMDGKMDCNRFSRESLFRSLICYNRAITYAEWNEETKTQDDQNIESELSLAFAGRSNIYFELEQRQFAIDDLERAIINGRSTSNVAKHSFQLLNLLAVNKDSMISNSKRLLKLIETIRNQFQCTPEQMSHLASIEDQLENHCNLRALNTINYGKPKVKKVLDSSSMPMIVRRDRPLMERFFSLQTTEGGVLAESILLDEKSNEKLNLANNVECSKLLIVERSFSHVPTFEPIPFHSHCSSCLLPLQFVAPIPCRQCTMEMYCTDLCRQQSWTDYHQYECGPSNRSIWARMDMLSRLTTRTLLRFGSISNHTIDFTREFLLDTNNRFNQDISNPTRLFDTKATFQYRLICEWFLKQIKSEPKLLVVQSEKFNDLLGQAYGVFYIINNARDQDSAHSSLITPDYLANLLHGIMLCIRMHDLAIERQIAMHIQECFAISVDDDDDVVDDERSKLENEEVKVNVEEKIDVEEHGRTRTIAIALYPTNIFLYSWIGQRTSCSLPTAPAPASANVMPIFNGTFRAIRAIKDIFKGDFIRMDFSQHLPLLSSHHHHHHRHQRTIERLAKEYFFWQDPISESVSSNDIKQDQLIAELNYVAKCMNESNDSPKRLQLLVRLCRLQFDLFLNKELPHKETIMTAKNCLINCSQALNKLELKKFPFQTYREMMKSIGTMSEYSLEKLVTFESIPLLAELEQMMIAANMFIEKFA